MLFLPLTENNCKPRMNNLLQNYAVHFVYCTALDRHWAGLTQVYKLVAKVLVVHDETLPLSKTNAQVLSHEIICKGIADDFHCFLSPIKEKYFETSERVLFQHVPCVELTGMCSFCKLPFP